jgi:hypothetical protein
MLLRTPSPRVSLVVGEVSEPQPRRRWRANPYWHTLLGADDGPGMWERLAYTVIVMSSGSLSIRIGAETSQQSPVGTAIAS